MHHHQMSPEQALGACHAACVLHIRRAIRHLIWWTVDGGFADMFVCVHEDMHPRMFRPDGSPPGTIHSLIHTVDKSVYKGSVHRRINVSETAPVRPPQSLTLCQRTMVTPWSFTAFTGLYQAPQDGYHSSVPNLRSLGSSPCHAAIAAWRDTGAKQARHRVLPQSRLIRANRQALSRVSEAVPPQRPVGQPGVVPPVFPFVTPLCPPYAP